MNWCRVRWGGEGENMLKRAITESLLIQFPARVLRRLCSRDDRFFGHQEGASQINDLFEHSKSVHSEKWFVIASALLHFTTATYRAQRSPPKFIIHPTRVLTSQAERVWLYRRCCLINQIVNYNRIVTNKPSNYSVVCRSLVTVSSIAWIYAYCALTPLYLWALCCCFLIQPIVECNALVRNWNITERE